MSVRFAPPPPPDVVKFKKQDYEKIRAHCLKNDVLWEDPQFVLDIGDLTWKRPWEIVTSPCFFQEDKATLDVRQGVLNNGYLVAAMQALAARPELLDWVVPENQTCSRDNSGLAHFRIWQLGTWYDVCVDDRLPTKDGKLVFIRSNNINEFWCALLEKAYAKLNGSYKVLEFGDSADALVDFTGGISEFVYLDEIPSAVGKAMLKAYKTNLLMCGLINYTSRVSTGRKKIDDYNYTITGVKLLSNNDIGVKLKDPKGYQEWTGPRSDPAGKWRLFTDDRKKLLGLEVDNDGEFWMLESDFEEQFLALNICHLSPHTVLKFGNDYGYSEMSNTYSFKGAWIRGVTAGGKGFSTIHLNNQYRILLSAPRIRRQNYSCNIVISLIQKNKTRQQEWSIGLKIFELKHHPEILPEILGSVFFSRPDNFNSIGGQHKKRREVVYRKTISPGIYCVIPCTKHFGEEGEFLLRIFTERKVVMEVSDRELCLKGVQDFVTKLVVDIGVPVAEESKTDEDVVSLFCKVAGKDMTVNWEALKLILENQMADVYDDSFLAQVYNIALDKIVWLSNLILPASSSPHSPETRKIVFSKELCRILITYIEDENSGRIGFDEFDKLWCEICQWKLIYRLHRREYSHHMDVMNLREALEKVGFILNNQVLGVLTQRYSDEKGSISFDDFIMCITNLKLDYSNFEKLDWKHSGNVVVTLDEWVEKSFFTR